MSIELELHLEGSDANEETLLDLLEWLKREDISDLSVERKYLPPVEEKMGADVDPYTIVAILLTIPPALHATQQMFHSFRRWQKTRKREVFLKVETKNANDDEIKMKIDALIEEIHQKRDKKKHNK
jgi:hypothetical protein